MLSADSRMAPSPLVCLTGDVEGSGGAPRMLIEALQLCFLAMDRTKNKLASINFKVLPDDHIFEIAPQTTPGVKSRREFLSKDVIKRSWMGKHCEERPSVVIMLCEFDLEWNPFEWSEKETIIQSRFINAMTNLVGMNTKLQLVAVKTGEPTPGGVENDEMLNERVNALMEALQIDSKTFTMISLNDFDGTGKDMNEGESPIQLLWHSIFVNSMNYYASMVKKSLTSLEALIGDVVKTYNDPVIVRDDLNFSQNRGLSSRDVNYLGLARARYNFKAGYFCDFQGLPHYSVGYYRKAFRALVSVTENVDGEERGAVLYLVELCNFKICTYLLHLGRTLSSGKEVVSTRKMDEVEQAYADAFKQFDFMVKSFKALDDSKGHNEWMCKQYLIFLGLTEGIPGTIKKVKVNQGEYFIMAAKYATKARDATHSMNRLSDLLGDSSPGGDKNDTIITRMGLALRDPEKKEDDITNEFTLTFPSDLDHNGLIADLLDRAYSRLAATHPRRKAFVLTMQCEQCMQQGDFAAAMLKLQPMLKELQSNKWGNTLAAPFLRKKMACAVYLGRLEEYLDGALRLYSLAVKKGPVSTNMSTVLSRYEVEELHRDILSVVSNYGREPLSPGPRDVPFSPLGKPANYTCVPFRPEYGMSSTTPEQLQYVLPSGFVFTTSSLPSSIHPRLVDVTLDMGGTTTYDVGQVVRANLHVTSLFLSRISFAEVRVKWSFDSFEQLFVNNYSGSSTGGESEEVAAEIVSLDLFPQETITFPLEFTLTESSISHLMDDKEVFLCLESVDFIVRSAFEAGLGGVAAPPVSPSGSPRDNTNSNSTPVKGAGGGEAVESTSTTVQDFVLRVLAVPDSVAEEHRHLMELKMPPNSDLSEYVSSAGGINAASDLNLAVLHVLRPQPTVELLYPVSDQGARRARRKSVNPNMGGSTSFLSLSDALTNKEVLATKEKGKNDASASGGALKKEEDGAVQLLAGAIQSVELLFSSGADDILGDPSGNLRVSSDLQPISTSQALFWWPSWTDGEEVFHPLDLDEGTHQPVGRFSTKSLQRGTGEGTFVFPLYICSETSGPANIMVTVEYANKQKSRTFPVKVVFSKPLEVLFDIEHSGDSWAGVQPQMNKDGGITAVVSKSPIAQNQPRSESSSASNSPSRGKSRDQSPSLAKEISTPERKDHTVLCEGPHSDAPPIVICGDTLAMSATLSCLEDLGEGVEITSFSLVTGTPSGNNGERSDNKTSRASMWADIDSPLSRSPGGAMLETSADVSLSSGGHFDILGATPVSEHSSHRALELLELDPEVGVDGDRVEEEVVGHNVLSRGEQLSGVADIQCLPIEGGLGKKRTSVTNRNVYETTSEPKTPSTGTGPANTADYVAPTVTTSIGHVKVVWRRMGMLSVTAIDSTTLPSLFLPAAVTGGISSNATDSGSGGCVNATITRTRLNSTVFDVPPVTLVEPPFNVSIEEPKVLVVGQPAVLRVSVQSTLWSVERVRLSVDELFGSTAASGGEVMDPSEGSFLVAGRVLQGVVVPPKTTVTTAFTIVPVRCGYSLLPKVQLLWSTHQASILNLRRAVFVQPRSESENQ